MKLPWTQGWKKTELTDTEIAAEDEIKLARHHGAVDSDGISLITIVADGSWMKRSHRINYNSLLGVVNKMELLQ